MGKKNFVIEKAKKGKLLGQFMILFLVLTLLILLTFCALIVYVQRTSWTQAKSGLEKKHMQMADNINNYFSDLENVAFAVSYSTITQQYLHLTSPLERILMNKEEKSLYMNTVNMQREIKGYSLMNKEGDMLLQYGYNINYGYIIEDKKTKIYYTGASTPSTGVEYFTLRYPVYEVKASKLLGDVFGYVGFTIETNRLTLFVQNSDIYAGSAIVLTDSKGDVITGSSAEAITFYNSANWEDNSTYLCLKTEVKEGGWNLYSIMPRNVVLQEFQLIMWFMAIAGIAICLLIFSMILLIYQRILSPIASLSIFMSEVPNDMTPARFYTRKQDEIGILANSMNHMLDALKDKNDALRISDKKRLTAELTKYQMELLAYRNQINPHFLYNTLECIRGIAMYHEADEIVEISQSLSKMFRYAVKGGDSVKVRDEIQYIREYAKIIGYRFSDRISIQFNVPEDLMDETVIKLCLQPIVENAVLHGIEPMDKDGKVIISGELYGEGINFVVKDDGVGMNDETLQMLRDTIRLAYDNEWQQTNEKHIGIINITRRLYLFYGLQSYIEIESVEGQGTRITLKLPLKREEINV